MKNRGRGVGVPTGIYATLSLSSSYAPRGASISCGLSRLRILPVTTGVYPILFHFSRVAPSAPCLCGKSHVLSSLPPLCRLFALFSALPTFVFNGLQPLFAKHPGGVGRGASRQTFQHGALTLLA